jgi:hypothetical protein
MKCKDGVEIHPGVPCPICGADSNQECRTRSYGLWLAERATRDEADADKLALDKALEQIHRARREAEQDRRVAG